MKTLKLPDRQITVVLHQQHWLYVYSEDTRQHIFSFVETVSDFTLEAAPNCCHWLLWVISISGHLYRIFEQTISESVTETVAVKEVNDSIFDALLPKSSDLNFQQNTEPTSFIRPQDSLLQLVPDSTALCVFIDLIIVSSITKDVCTVNVYQKEDIASVSERKASAALIVPCLTKCIPLQIYDSQSCDKHMNLYLVTSSSNSSIPCSQTIQLPLLVFTSLFGAEASLLHSAVILLTMPSGFVYYFSLKQWKPQQNSMDCPLSVLCNLNAPIVKVCLIYLRRQSTSDLPTETMPNSQSPAASTSVSQNLPCLLLAAKNGKCFLFSPPSNFKNQLKVLETIHLEDSPISDCCLGIKPYQLVYATRKKVIQLDLNYNEGISQTTKHIASLSAISTLAVLQLKDDNKLLCLSNHGQFYSLSVSEEGLNMNAQLKQEENSVSQLLSQVENINKNIKRASGILDAQSHVISQFVTGSHLTRGQFVSSNIQCKLTVFKDIYGKTILQCAITNRKLTFTSDWSFLVEAVPSRKYQESNHTTCHSLVKTLSLANGLKPEESALIDIIPNIMAPSDTRIRVSVWLVFNLPFCEFYLDSPNDISRYLETQLSKGMAIPVFKGNTDFLSFVLPLEREESKIHSISSIKSPSLTKKVQTIACDKPIYATVSDPQKDLVMESEQLFTHAIDIPASLKNSIFDHNCTDSTHQSCLLNDLLTKMEVMSCDVTDSSVTLNSTDCGQLIIAVHQKDHVKYILEIQASSQGVVAETVHAILLRLMKLLSDKPTVTLDCSKFGQEMEIITEEVKSIQEDLNSTEMVDSKIMTRVLLAYLKSRNLDFIITSDLTEEKTTNMKNERRKKR
ncbi:uncharacterized protein LOC106876609 isoform X2 [Octopus bimaculoides]|uniref:uncharacterized protein LOC106876609 isoform X2 n=1 Tax=Octopus bimaculoides TaxID=37653 RepID=UPI0022E2ED88|nr:uncharacterized protein LOC106876609 isoform X2 [Octopus bimaculoides]